MTLNKVYNTWSTRRIIIIIILTIRIKKKIVWGLVTSDNSDDSGDSDSDSERIIFENAWYWYINIYNIKSKVIYQ